MGTVATWFGSLGSSAAGYILPFLFVLTIVVFFHELGHFLVARWCGVFVRTFSIGFGPELLGFTDRKGTRWRLSLIPLGGYVKFLGDDSEASTPDREALAAMPAADRSRTFAGKNVWARFAIVAAGPIANFILAIIIFAGLAMFLGEDQVVPRIDGVKPGSAAEAAGFRVGDVVTSIDGTSINSYAQVALLIATSSGRQLGFVVDRNGQSVPISVVPERRPQPDGFGGTQDLGSLDISGPAVPARVAQIDTSGAAAAAGFQVGDVIRSVDGTAVSSFPDLQTIVLAAPGKQLSFSVERAGQSITLVCTPTSQLDKDGKAIGRLGVRGDYDPADLRHQTYGVGGAVQYGLDRVWFVVDRTAAYTVGIFAGRESPSQIGGAVRLAQVAEQAASISFATLVNWAAFVSVSIGLLNLLPIPVLDGGHLLFFVAEAIRGRPLSERVQDAGLRLGFLVIVALIVFANGNDIGLWHNLGAFFSGS